MNPNERHFRPLKDYAVIGDAYTAALVASDGSIDWCCLPSFDSPAVFCRILDTARGGWFRVGPAGGHQVTRSYLGSTNVLATTFSSDGGQFRVTDFMPSVPILESRNRQDIATNHQIVRIVEGISGETECEIEFRPTFDFARARTRLEIFKDGVIAQTDSNRSSCSVPYACRPTLQDRLTGGAVSGPATDLT